MSVIISKELKVPVLAIKLSDFAEGDTVYINENGSPVPFYVAKHNYESGLNGANRTLLVRKNTFVSNRIWDDEWFDPDEDSEGIRSYANSVINDYLTDTYKNTLSSKVQSVIGNTTFYYSYTRFTNWGSTANVTVSTMTAPVFTLSVPEVGYTHTTDGTALPIVNLLKGSTAFWLRSASIRGWQEAYAFTSNGTIESLNAYGGRAYLPCFTMHGDTLFEAETFVFKEDQ